MDTNKTESNNGSQPKLFQICVEGSQDNMASIELNVHGDMKIEEIKKMVFEKFIEFQNTKDKYFSYEKYDPKTDKERLDGLYRRLQLCSHCWSRNDELGNLEANKTLQESFQDNLSEITSGSKEVKLKIYYYMFRSLDWRHFHRFICSSPTVSFEFVEEYDGPNGAKAIGLYERNCEYNTNIKILKKRIYETLQSNASIYLKKKGVSEYLELQDDEPVPAQDIYIKFDEEPKIADKLQSKLYFAHSKEQRGEVALQNIKVREHAPKGVKEYFENFTSARKEKSHNYHKKAGIGAASGFFVTFANQLLLGNPAYSTGSSLFLSTTVMRFATHLFLGTALGGIVGIASYYLLQKYFISHSNPIQEITAATSQSHRTT